jgi:putative protease
MSASVLNSIRRTLAENLSTAACIAKPLLNVSLENPAIETFPELKATYRQNISNRISEKVYAAAGAEISGKAYELEHSAGAELMRTRYCIRYELGICPVHQGAKESAPLFLLNNGKRLALHFDCRRCEMTVRL